MRDEPFFEFKNMLVTIIILNLKKFKESVKIIVMRINTKIYFIIDEHPSAAFTLNDPELAERVNMRRIFNANFIKEHYREGDHIWIEDDASLEKELLNKDLLPGMSYRKYSIGGCDNPAACCLAKVLIAIQTIFLRVYMWMDSAKKDDLEAVQRFVTDHVHPELPLPDTKTDTLVAYFPLSLDIAQENYVDDTWEMRQSFMTEKIASRLAEGKSQFVVTGELHVKAWLPFPCPYEVIKA